MIYKGNFEQVIKKINNYTLEQNNLFVYGIHDKKIITVGYENDFKNLSLVNIPHYDIGRAGGTIVHDIGDISGLFIIDKPKLNRVIVDYFINKLKSKGLQVSRDNNDILIDNIYKVMGFACIPLKNNKYYFSFQISVHNDWKTIFTVCKHIPLNKIPRGLSDYGISTEECEKWLLDFLVREYGEIELELLTD